MQPTMNGTGAAEPMAIPKHVAFIMDGNGRWATRQGLPRLAGHQAGIARVATVAAAVKARGVQYMSLFMFSTENWRRPHEEVQGIFDLLTEWLRGTAPLLKQQGIGLRHIGRREALPGALLEALDRACGPGVDDHDLTLCLAINYGGRAEIVDAIKGVLARGLRGDEIDEGAIGSALYTAGIPDPDLLVRPGGEQRLSNFMLWQVAYAELYYSHVLWPDFEEKEVDRAFQAFELRQRRFGGLR